MAKEYVTATIIKYTEINPQAHPEDTRLVAKIYDTTIWSFNDEDHLNDFIAVRAGRVTFDCETRKITVTTTPKDLKSIKEAQFFYNKRNNVNQI